MYIARREPFSRASWSQKENMSKKKRSFWEDVVEFATIAVFTTYFIIANAFLGASTGHWSYDHAEIFSQGLFILLGVVVAAGALYFGIVHLNRRLNPPPPPPTKKRLPNRRPFEKRTAFSQPQSPMKAKNDQVRYTRRNHPTSDLPF